MGHSVINFLGHAHDNEMEKDTINNNGTGYIQ